YTERFDRVKLDDVVVRVAELPDPELPADVAAAFDVAFSNIHKFHLAQMPSSSFQVETMPGVVCGRVARPIERVGRYKYLHWLFPMPYAPPCHPPPLSQPSGCGLWASDEAHRVSGAVQIPPLAFSHAVRPPLPSPSRLSSIRAWCVGE
ncbi:unnamed protein product, partial [Closterium sp. NIES-54]